MRSTVLLLGFVVAFSPICLAQELIWKKDGAQDQEQVGASLAILPDLDADGLQELLIGAPGHTCVGWAEGIARVFFDDGRKDSQVLRRGVA